MPHAKISKERLAVSHRMQRALATAGYTQVEAARQGNVPRGVIHKAVQRGSVPRDKPTRDAVAKVLNVKADWLWQVGEEGAINPQRTQEQAKAAAVSIRTERPTTPERTQPATTPAPGLRYDPDGYVKVVPHGDFAPLALRNDCLWITPSYAPEAGARVYVKVKDEELLAVLSEENGEHYYLQVPGGGRRTLRKDSVDALHQVAGVLS